MYILAKILQNSYNTVTKVADESWSVQHKYKALTLNGIEKENLKHEDKEVEDEDKKMKQMILKITTRIMKTNDLSKTISKMLLLVVFMLYIMYTRRSD